MKRGFKLYALCWAVFLITFNVICFVTPKHFDGYEKFSGAFWSCYIFITLAFVGQLICAHFALKAENLQKLFYNLSLITTSYTGLVLTIICGAICMVIPNLPNWLGVIVCFLILALNTVSIIKASVATEIVVDVDEKINKQTQFIKNSTMFAQNIMNGAKNEEIKSECKRVYEELRYSDPMSSEDLQTEETNIAIKMNELNSAIRIESKDISQLVDEIILLIRERNKKCKGLK